MTGSGEMRHIHRILVENPKRRRQLGTRRQRWKINITEIDF